MKMSHPHPKEHQIAKAVLNSHFYKKLKKHCNNHPIFGKMENTVLCGLHVIEFVFILAAGVVTTTFALNMPTIQTITTTLTGSTTAPIMYEVPKWGSTTSTADSVVIIRK